LILSDGDPTCTKSPSTHTGNMACFNVIENSLTAVRPDIAPGRRVQRLPGVPGWAA
jgi:hypothetical protein